MRHRIVSCTGLGNPDPVLLDNKGKINKLCWLLTWLMMKRNEIMGTTMSTLKYVTQNMLAADRELHEARVDIMLFTEIKAKTASDAELDDFLISIRDRLLSALTQVETTMITVDLERVVHENNN